MRFTVLLVTEVGRRRQASISPQVYLSINLHQPTLCAPLSIYT